MKTLLKEYRKLLLVVALPYLFVVVASIIRVDYDITAPGDLNEVREVISVETNYDQKGSFNTVSVFTNDRTTLLTYLIAKLNPRIAVEESIPYIQLSNKENYRSGTIQKNVSITNSLIAAYRSAGKEIITVFQGMIIHTTSVDKADGLYIGDIITEWEGNPITNGDTLRNLIANTPFVMGKSYQAVVLRPNNDEQYEKRIVEVTPKKANDEGNPYFGLYLYEYYTITEANPGYTLHKTRTLGPSGGLMQALSIYNAITADDITYGLRVAGTGTIDSHGNVGSIGGVRQKVITAHLSGADVFFVPVIRTNGVINLDASDNYVEAKEAHDALGRTKMQLVPVETLNEAIGWLVDYVKTKDYQ